MLVPTGGLYPPGTEITLTAVAAPMFAFSRWSGDVSGLKSPVTVTLDSNQTVTAHFKEDDY